MITHPNPMSEPKFPPEIIEKITLLIWRSSLSPSERILLMTTYPLLDRTWKAQFARIASREIHVPNLHYLLYLVNIVRKGKSLIYDQTDLKKHGATMTCFLDMRSYPDLTDRDRRTEDIYWILGDMGNYSGLRICFPSLKELRLEAVFYTPMHLWTSEMAQVAHTQIVLDFDEWEELKGAKKKDHFRLLQRNSNHNFTLKIAIHDPDAYLGVTNALWKYRSGPLSTYFMSLCRVVLGGCTRFRFRNPQDSPLEYETAFGRLHRLGENLQKSQRLEGTIHLFDASATFIEDSADYCYFTSKLWERCGKESSFPLDQEYRLTLRSWQWSLGGVDELGMNELRDGEWDLILPVSGERKDNQKRYRNPISPYWRCVGLEPPFSAVDNLRGLIASGMDHSSLPDDILQVPWGEPGLGEEESDGAYDSG
ncbi:hypothetical protein VKT23_016955 [Stygiomarasmius scandens]|uniref:Uncharacterized protein n=1 Tax=Marasmiellus scandens TaxID=2682957 RepID=A0ABR1IVL8_9AGAR